MSSENLLKSYQRNNNPYNVGKIVLLLSLLLLATNFFSFGQWGTMSKGLGLNFIVSGFLFLAFVTKNPAGKENFKPLVYMLIAWPFLSALASLSIYNQSLFDSLKGLVPNMFWLIYFIMNRNHFKEATIIKALLIYSLIMLLIMIVQQFTYPHVYFGVLSEELMLEKGVNESVSQRNGIYRFIMHQNGYTAVPVLLYYLNNLKNRFAIKRISIVLLMLLAVYMSLTRQVIASALFVILLSVVINKKGAVNIKYFVIICILAFAIYANSEYLFGEFTRTTKEDINKDYIRLFAYSFYWDKICENDWTFIIGHGIAKAGSFLHQFNYWQEVLKLYTSDIGIIGIWFHYGFVYVLLYFYSMFLIFKYRKQIPMYVVLFSIFAGLMAVMICPFGLAPIKYIIWAMILYICDLHINKSPLRTQFY